MRWDKKNVRNCVSDSSFLQPPSQEDPDSEQEMLDNAIDEGEEDRRLLAGSNSNITTAQKENGEM